MIITPNKSDITSNEDMISKSDVALNDAARPKLDAFAKLHDLIRRPNTYAPRNSYHSAPPSIAAPG
jgi:hypothetical protein